ncbi:MAG TPA: PstS family phosphate ABC transporter substrate-binding protein [Candidatus Limnocylindria bacterium]|nr:PstS family phosphate ABC transporter substrate-binding protein [Candidatus Limnocylindria bacterium]
MRRGAPVALALAVALGLAACGGSSAGSSPGSTTDGGTALSGAVRVDGSSTVAPMSTIAAELFQDANAGVQVTVGTSGTGGGFEKFCNGETDINDASRSIKDEEAAACEEKGITYQELTVALDALTVVVNKENDWATCLTVEQLATIWGPDSKVDNWNQVDPSFPDEKLTLFGPGTDSGTFDYFTDAINGEEGVSRTDYSPSEDDNITVQGVEGSKGALGYFGFTYYEENAEAITAVSIDNGAGCVAPSPETAQDGTYAPLSRPLFIYPSGTAIKQPQVDAFVQFYVDNDAQIAEEGLFIPLNSDQSAELKSTWSTFQAANG